VGSHVAPLSARIMMIPVSLVLVLAVSHWVGDFAAQSRRIALSKSSSNKALTEHVCFYTVALFWGVTIYSGFQHHPSLYRMYAFVAINGTLHWITDYITSRINARLWTQNDQREFWLMIGADQWLLHLPTLILTAY